MKYNWVEVDQEGDTRKFMCHLIGGEVYYTAFKTDTSLSLKEILLAADKRVDEIQLGRS